MSRAAKLAWMLAICTLSAAGCASPGKLFNSDDGDMAPALLRPAVAPADRSDLESPLPKPQTADADPRSALPKPAATPKIEFVAPAIAAHYEAPVAPDFAAQEHELPLDDPPVDFEILPLPEGTRENASAISLEDIILSVQQSFPLLHAALLEYQIAEGQQTAAWGEFDRDFKADSISQPLGFYKNYRNRLKLGQPTFNGGEVFAQYRIGRGLFEPWYEERLTNEAGEFKVGLTAALLKNRHIDERRAALFQADVDLANVDPFVRAQVLEFVRLASNVYWEWVAARQAVEAQRELLELATQRVGQIEERVKAGDLEEIAGIDNERLIADREAKLIAAQRKLQQASIKLSLFWRNELGKTIVPTAEQAPTEFPAHHPPDEAETPAMVAQAIEARPEMNSLTLQLQRVEIELAAAENKLLPKLDARLEASKDVGGASSMKRDKTPFVLEAGVFGEVPLQRREARGKIRAAQGKLAQIEAKRQMTADKIAVEVQDALSAMSRAAERIQRAEKGLSLAQQSLEFGRDAFEAGDIDVIVLNIREEAVNTAQLTLIQAQADFFIALANFNAALALDPLH